MDERHCKACGKVFDTEPLSTRAFCSVSCQYQSRRRSFRQCNYCSVLYRPAAQGGREYCSRKCSSLAQQKRIESNCQHCGKLIIAAPSTDRTYCSKECHDRAREKWYICQNCGGRYHPGSNGGLKYCSRECSAAGRDLHQSRTCDVCGKTFITRGKSDQKYCSQKCNSVVQQRRRHDSGYYPDKVEVICEQCGTKFMVSPSHALNTSNGSRKRFCSQQCKYIASRQKWPVEKTKSILYTCQECGEQWYDKPSLRHRKKFCSRSCVGSATIRRLQTESPTSIEVATYQALRDLSIDFEPQYRIGRWVVDAFVPELNLIIECQGDFHHCNPAVFPNGPQHDIQRKTIDRDKRRFEEFELKGYKAIQLWEKDIHSVGAKALLMSLLTVHIKGVPSTG